jgi:hypothetical protein
MPIVLLLTISSFFSFFFSVAHTQVAIKALDLIGKAMHPTHLGAAYVLRQRDELLGNPLEYVAPTVDAKKSSSPRKDEHGVPHAVRIAGLNAIATYTYPPDPCPVVLGDTRTHAHTHTRTHAHAHTHTPRR